MTPQPLRLLALFLAIAVTCFAIGEVAITLAGGRAVNAASGAGATVALSLVAATVLTAVAIAWHRSRWRDPAVELVETIDRLTAGQWDLHADPRGAVTIQALAQRVNRLAQNVRSQLDDLRIGRGDLQTLVDTLPDPIIATDAGGRIVLINRPASRLLDLPRSSALGTRLVAAVNDNALLELFDATTKDGESSGRDDVAHADRTAVDDENAAVRRPIKLLRNGSRFTFDGYATRTVGGGVLLVLRDVTQLAATLQMKTDFVANASHELRTPLAAIKIAFETLGDVYGDDPQQAERCIAIIGGHLNRLEEMLRDLLDLSRVESADLNPQPQRVKASEVFALVRIALGTFARDKGVDLRLDDDGTADTFFADERLLNLALKNLAENSIKFTPAGGSVTVSFTRAGGADGQGVTIAVADTGIGIPVEHQARVFERFYQVDPARSGSAGRGTGLGLAIVKHAIAGLGGVVELESTPGHGTTVSVVLPDASGAGSGVSLDRAGASVAV